MNKLLTIIISLVALSVTFMSAGCIQTADQPMRDAITVFDAVCGVRVTIDVDVTIHLTDQFDEGTTHYRIFDVDVSTPTSVSLSPATVCSREPILNGRTVGPYELYSDQVGQWNGLDWNDNGMTSVTTTNDESSDEVYDIPKPGRYATIFGYTFGIQDLKDALGTQQIVPSFFRFGVQEKLDDLMGTIQEFKIPFLATLPRYTDGRSIIVYHYQVEFYIPIGGRLLGDTPDEIEFTFYETHQSFKIGYDKPAWAAITIPGWILYSASAALYVIGVTNPLLAMSGAAMFAATAGLFGVDWSEDFTLFKWDDDLEPFFVALDTTPTASRVSARSTISVE